MLCNQDMWLYQSATPQQRAVHAPGRLPLHAYELLGTAADPFVAFPSLHGAPAAEDGRDGAGDARERIRVDTQGVMDHLLALQRWDDARGWACASPPVEHTHDMRLGQLQTRCSFRTKILHYGAFVLVMRIRISGKHSGFPGVHSSAAGQNPILESV